MAASQEIFDVVRAGDTVKLKALLASDPKLASIRNEQGHSPVLIAQYHRKRDAVALLLAAGAELDLFDAASVGATARVAELLDRDPLQVNAYSSDGFYPLGLAAFFGHPETVRLLLARGADVGQTARNAMRVQPLHAAVASRSMDVVRVIVAAGAPIDAQQQDGWTALHAAVHQGNAEMTRYLLAHGADPKVQNDAGKSATDLGILKLLEGDG